MQFLIVLLNINVEFLTKSLLPPGVEDDETPPAPPPPSLHPIGREESPERDELKLPQALEQALAFKNQRAQALGVKEERMSRQGIFYTFDVK